MGEKTQQTRPNSQLDLERRLKVDNDNPDVKVVGTTNPDPVGAVEEAYIGTDPIYQNHANDTEKPYSAEKGPEKEQEEAFVDSQLSHLDPVKDADFAKDTSTEDKKALKDVHAANKDKNAVLKEQQASDARGPFADNEANADKPDVVK